MRTVRLHPAADDELIAATAWYVDRSATAAAAFVREVEHAIARIIAGPERYPLTLRGRRRFVLLNYPYDVVYRFSDTEIEVVAIAHHARKPGYWRHRA